MRRAQDGGMQRARRHPKIVDKTTAPAKQRGVLNARQRAPDPRLALFNPVQEFPRGKPDGTRPA